MTPGEEGRAVSLVATVCGDNWCSICGGGVMSETVISPVWEAKLRHMLGAPKKPRRGSLPGYRNHFCAEIGFDDDRTLVAMAAAGLVREGRTINDGSDRYWIATEAGMDAIGLSKAGKKRAMR